MLQNHFFVFILVICIKCTLSSASLKFPGFKIPCKDTSPECLKDSLQAIIPEFTRGIPELDVSPLDPFDLTDLTIGLPGGVNINFPQGYTKGLRKCIVDSVRNTGGDDYEVILHCDLKSTSTYRMAGKILMFEIDGDGDSTIICRNLKLTATFRIGFTNKDGQEYAQIENVQLKHAFEGQVSYNITNLFKESPLISNMILEFMNQNWRMVAEEFGGPFIDYSMKAILINLKKILNAVPANELFIQ